MCSPLSESIFSGNMPLCISILTPYNANYVSDLMFVSCVVSSCHTTLISYLALLHNLSWMNTLYASLYQNLCPHTLFLVVSYGFVSAYTLYPMGVWSLPILHQGYLQFYALSKNCFTCDVTDMAQYVYSFVNMLTWHSCYYTLAYSCLMGSVMRTS